MRTKSYNKWVGKHSLSLRTFQVTCKECDAVYDLDAQVRPPESYCLFCEADEPVDVKEVQDGGVQVAQ